MNKIIEEMLNSLHPESNEEKKNALKEVIQEIALCGLSRGGFFHKTAFYGGTALRIFYGLDRFSEDLDFSLMKPDDKFDLKGFFPYLENEFQAYGFDLKRKDRGFSHKICIYKRKYKGALAKNIPWRRPDT